MIIPNQEAFNKCYPKEVINLIYLVLSKKPHNEIINTYGSQKVLQAVEVFLDMKSGQKNLCAVFAGGINKNLKAIESNFSDLKNWCTFSIIMKCESPALRDLSQEVFGVNIASAMQEGTETSFDNWAEGWRIEGCRASEEVSSRVEAFYTGSNTTEENETLPLGQAVEDI